MSTRRSWIDRMFRNATAASTAISATRMPKPAASRLPTLKLLRNANMGFPVRVGRREAPVEPVDAWPVPVACATGPGCVGSGLEHDADGRIDIRRREVADRRRRGGDQLLRLGRARRLPERLGLAGEGQLRPVRLELGGILAGDL